jgi:transposase-like protein
METASFAVSEWDMKRYEILKQVMAGRLTLMAAAAALGVSYRQAKRLKARAAEGAKAMGHGNRGRAPANRHSEEVRLRVLALSAERYAEFNDSHFTQMLASREHLVVNRETVRQWRRAAGIRPKQRRRPPKHHQRRPRKSLAGLMMLWDGSPHHWFGPSQPPCCLMAAIDDATSELLAAFFAPVESSWAYLTLLSQVIARHGIPASVYQDKHGALKRNDAHWSLEEELAGEQTPTQVGGALKALQIEAIFAHSPQAKGRVERLFRTLQDRLVALLALEGIAAIAPANAYLQAGGIAAFNAEFATQPAQAGSAWRRPAQSLDLPRVLSLRYSATVGNDNAVRLDGMTIDIPPGPQGRGYPKAKVEVCQVLDGSWRVYYQDRCIATASATEIAELIRTHRRRTGGRATTDTAWVFAASAPNALAAASAPPRPAPLRRAGPGRAIGATRIA